MWLKNKKIPWVTCLAIFVASISPLLSVEMLFDNGYHETQRWWQIALLAIVFIFSLVNAFKGSGGSLCFSPTFRVLCFLFFLSGMLAVCFSDFPGQALFEWGLFVFLALLVFVVAGEVFQLKNDGVYFCLIIVAVGCLLYEVKAIATYVVALVTGVYSGPAYLIPGFDSYRFFNHGQTVTLPLLALLINLVNGRKEVGQKWIFAVWMVFVFWWVLLFVSSGRGTLVGICVAISVVSIVFKSLAWPWVRVMVLGGGAGFVCYAVLYVVIPWFLDLPSMGFLESIVERSLNSPGSRRGKLWWCAIEMIVDRPWFGFGPVGYANFCSPLKIAAHPHNWVLQIFSEWGFFSLFILIVLIVRGLILLRSSKSDLVFYDSRGLLILVGFFGAGFAILVDGLFSGLLVMPVSQLWIVIYLGLAIGWFKGVHEVGGKISRSSLGRSILMVVFFVFIFSLAVVGIFSSIESARISERSGLPLAPRVWGYGYF